MTFDPPSTADPAPRSRAAWPSLAAGGAGVAVLLVLALLHPGLAGSLLAGAVLVAAVTVLAALRSSPQVRAPVAAASPDADAGPRQTALFQETLDALTDPVMVIEGGDPDDFAARRIVFANQAARDLLRIQREGALLVTVLRDPEVLEVVDEALYGDAARVTDFQPGGAQDRYWRAGARPLAAGVQGPRAVLRLRDETDARRMEKMRVDLLANASHELRTPLASLTGFIETLKGHARDDPAARDRFLDIMAAQAERMKRLIADLLSLSRIELNEHIPPSGTVDLALLVADVIDAQGPLAETEGVRLTVRAPEPGRAVVTGDRDELVQVAQNLIDNAVKYSPAGGEVEITVEAGLTAAAAGAGRWSGAARFALLGPDRDDSARYSLLSVRDHGPGLQREHLPRLTERFYRVEGQKSGARPGTGLGLAIAKHILNRHRGGMLVESLPGEGAIFSAYLPEASPRVQR